MAGPSVPSTVPLKNNMPLAENWCFTQIKVVKYSYVWVIDNFSFWEKGDEALTSSTFSSEGNDKLKWSLRVYPKGKAEEDKNYLSLYLTLVSSNKLEVKAKYKVCILNAKKEEYRALETQTVFSPGMCMGYKKFIKRELLSNYANLLLPNDKLTLFCEVSVMAESVNVAGQSKPTKSSDPHSQQSSDLKGLSNDFGSLLQSQGFSDVTISVSGKEFKAHKAILAARSPVFAAMFAHDLEEKKQNRVEIQDMNVDVMKEMLRFIYTGRTANLEKTAIELLAAADRYAIEKLKVRCEEALHTNLCTENLAEVLILGDLHSAEQLKAQALEFFKINATEVMETQAWKSMVQSHPHLIAEACKALASLQIPPIGPPKKKIKVDKYPPIY